MSLAAPWGRVTPRWSVAGKGAPPASITLLPLSRAWVFVGPPLSLSLPSFGFLALTSPGRVKPQLVPFSRLLSSEMTGSLQLFEVLKADLLFATIVFLNVALVPTLIPPPSSFALLEATVLFVIVAVPSNSSMPPPYLSLLLPLTVELASVRVSRWFWMPPPISALLALTVLPVIVIVLPTPLLVMPPPSLASLPRTVLLKRFSVALKAS